MVSVTNKSKSTNIMFKVLKIPKYFLYKKYSFFHSLFWIALSIQCTGLPRGPDKLQ